MVVEKKDLDWSSLGFSYIKTDYRFRARWREGVWLPGELVESRSDASSRRLTGPALCSGLL